MKSSFRIKDLIEISPTESYDLEICEGLVPEHLENAQRFKAIDGWSEHEYNGVAFLLKYYTIGTFYIEGDHKITLQKDSRTSEEYFMVLLLNICFIYLFQMNDLFPIHSSSVQVGDGCILFLGNSGAGKSTTATHFFRNNHKIVTDDLSLIDFDKNGHPFVYPSYPQLRLWEKSLDVFEIEKDDLIKINYQQSKFKKMLSLEDYASQPLPLKKMYFIALSSNDELNFTEIKGMEKVKVISSQVFGDSIIKTFGKSVAYFTFCQQLTERIALCKIERPSNKLTIDEIYDYVLNDLKENKNII